MVNGTKIDNIDSKNFKNYRVLNYLLDKENSLINPIYNDDYQFNICFLSTINYFKYLAVTIKSFESTNKHIENLEFIILTDKNDEKEFLKLSKNFPNYFFTFICIEKQNIDLSSFMEWGWNKNWNPLINCKLVLTNKVFSEYNKILFLDVDTLVVGDLKELFEKTENFKIAGVNDFPTIDLNALTNTFKNVNYYNYEFREKIVKEYDCSFNFYNYIKNCINVSLDSYINAGVLLINTKNNKDFSKTKDWLKGMAVLEQDMWNKFFENEKTLLSPIYNFPFTNEKDFEDSLKRISSKKHFDNWANIYKKRKIIHFYLSSKPWSNWKNKKLETYNIWFKEAKSTIYWKQIKKSIKLNTKKANKKKIKNLFIKIWTFFTN